MPVGRGRATVRTTARERPYKVSVVDTFSDTDPPGYRLDLMDDGTVHITGNGMDQTFQAEGAQSAKQWYDQNADAFLPLPAQVDSFVSAAREAGRDLAYAATKATPSAADETEVAAFASAVAAALISAGQASSPLGIGSDLVGLGSTITVNAARAQAAPQGALSGAWNGLDQAIDFYSLAEHAQQDRGVNDDAKSQLKAFSSQAKQVGAAVDALITA